MTHSISHTAKFSAAMALGLLMAVASNANAEQTVDISIEEATDEAFVVASMAANFESFGLGRQQAQMLAEQTADFGTIGMLTTVAAIGIGTEQAEMIIAQDEGFIDAIDLPGTALTAHLD